MGLLPSKTGGNFYLENNNFKSLREIQQMRKHLFKEITKIW